MGGDQGIGSRRAPDGRYENCPMIDGHFQRDTKEAGVWVGISYKAGSRQLRGDNGVHGTIQVWVWRHVHEATRRLFI